MAMTQQVRGIVRRALLALCFASAAAVPAGAQPSNPATMPAVPTVEQILASRSDLLGESALRQPGGPSYEAFAAALPPLRYVDAPFRHYPIVLSAPGAAVKGRLISNGSALNALARQPNWRGEIGTPVTIRIGHDRATFGEDLRQLDGPRYDSGYLPIVQLRYRHNGAVYAQEIFASTDPELAQQGTMLAHFTLAEGAEGKVEAQFEGSAILAGKGAAVRTADGKVLASHDSHWDFNPARNTLTAILAPGQSVCLAIFTKPSDRPLPLAGKAYEDQRQRCRDDWEKLLARGMRLDVPEPIVNQAQRALVIGSFSLLSGDDLRYSAGNQYAKLYIGEGGDAVRSLALLGYSADARRMIVPLFDYTRKGLEFHQAAFKLQLLAHYFQLTGDADFLREQRPRWEKELNVILQGREKSTGMLPREKYCGDIETKVYSLNSNANCWRALRDTSTILADLGEADRARELAATAAEYRKIILDAVERNTRRAAGSPPFIPIALSGEEDVHDPITDTVIGSYWNLMINYVLGSGVFRYDSPAATDVMQYLQQKGGLCMGMLRSQPGKPTGWWVGGGKINDLYGMRYALLLLQRDEPDRALVSFYGKLAQGMTRDTFIGAEGTSIRPEDEFGRQMYLPPNSAANANFLQQLRYLLVQDWDLDDDGRPETLRLLFATPRHWLRDAAEIRVERAPTAFGELSLIVRSQLKQGRILAAVTMPPRPPAKALLRLRLPAEWSIAGATIEGQRVPTVDAETLDLSGRRGRFEVVVRVAPGAKK